MNQQEQARRRTEAIAEFEQHEHRGDGTQLVRSLSDGLSLLRDSFFDRVHRDVEKDFGTDSMILDATAIKNEANADSEIEIYLVVESAIDAMRNRSISSEDRWFCDWLGRLRLGESFAAAAVSQRIAYYLERSADDRRRAFSARLQRVFPESGHAPLIIYRLFPLAISITTAIAFGQLALAEETRKGQIAWLPGIAYCPDCHGRLLGERGKMPAVWQSVLEERLADGGVRPEHEWEARPACPQNRRELVILKCMSFDPSPLPQNFPQADEAWQEIDDLVDELVRLAAADIPATEFHQTLLDRAVRGLAAVGGAIWIRNSAGQIQLECQVNLDGVPLAANWADAQRHTRLLEHVLSQGSGRAVAPLAAVTGEMLAANPTSFLLLLSPLAVDIAALGILEIFQRAGAQPGSERGNLRFLATLNDLAADFQRNRQLQQLREPRTALAVVRSIRRAGALEPGLAHNGLHDRQRRPQPDRLRSN